MKAANKTDPTALATDPGTIAENPTQDEACATGDDILRTGDDTGFSVNKSVLAAGRTPGAAEETHRTGQYDSLKTGAFDGSTVRGETPATGSRLDAYEILGELGEGGMGVVFKARQVGLNRIVALKMVISGGRASARQLERFRTEAQAVARLEHPNIVRIYDIGDDNGVPFFTMEFVDGVTLEKKLKRQPMEPLAAARMMETVSRAVHFAHTRGVIHRDLKPANVMLTESGEPKIADFGLAKQLDEQSEGSRTEAGQVLGTPNYMSPEQAEGHTRDVTPLADVYSLGASLYELLTGRPPFQGPSIINIINQVKTLEPVAPRTLQPNLPRDIETICLKCLQKDVAKRYASAEALADDLRRFIKGEPILARPIGFVERAVRWCKRNPKIASLTAAAALLAVLFVATLSVYSVIVRNQRDEIEGQKQALESANTVITKERDTVREQRNEIAGQKQAVDKLNSELSSANVAITKERDAAQRLSDLNAETARYMIRKLSGDLKVLGLSRQREELVQFVMKNLDKLEKLSAEGETIVNRGRVSAAMHVAEMFQELAGADASRAAELAPKAEEYYRKALAASKAIADKEPQSDIARGNYALTLNRLGVFLVVQGKLDDAEPLLNDALKIRKDIVEAPRSQRGGPGFIYPADGLSSLAESHYALGLLTDARKNTGGVVAHEQARRETLERALALVKADPNNSDESFGLAGIQNSLAESYLESAARASAANNAGLAQQYLNKALALREQSVADHADVLPFKKELANTLLAIGVAQLSAKKNEDARKSFDRMYSLMDQVVKQGDELTSRDNRWLLGISLYGVGVSSVKLNDRRKAVSAFKDRVRILRQLAEEDPARARYFWGLMVTLARSGDHEQAVEVLKQEQARNRAPDDFWFNAACTYSLAADCVGQWAPDNKLTPQQLAKRMEYVQNAFAAIREMFQLKAKSIGKLETEPDLEYVQQLPAFKALLAELRK